METWFENVGCIKIPVSQIDLDTVSFTYGDMFPVFKRALDTGEEYWGQVYRYDEMVKLIEKTGIRRIRSIICFRGNSPRINRSEIT